jgi:general secretion pathway protein B
MSFILDALRKSETERQRQSAPSLSDARYQVAKKKRNPWLPLATIVLAANAIGIAYFVFNNTAEPDKPIPARPIPVRPVPAAPVARAPAPAAEKAPVPVAVVQRSKPKPPPPVEPVSAKLTVTEMVALPSMQQLMQAGMLSVEPLSVDLHVYAGEASKRFVFINMKKYREGETLVEGPRVDEITDSGAILTYQGNRFRLDRQ